MLPNVVIAKQIFDSIKTRTVAKCIDYEITPKLEHYGYMMIYSLG